MGPETRFKQKVLQWMHQLPMTWTIKIQQVAILGTPDILACVNGQFVAIELKASTKDKATKLQEHVLNKIAGCGGLSFVLSPEGFEVFKKHLIQSCLKGIVFDDNNQLN